MGYLRDIERLIRIALPQEDRRTPGSRDAARRARSRAAPGRTVRATGPYGPIPGIRAHEAAPASKALAAAAVGVVIMPRRRQTIVSRRVRRRGKSEVGASPSCHRESRPNTQPTATPGHSTSRRAIWRTTLVKKS